ncbi:DmsE family decaheme c-type cytochrome [Candidatus Aminicenantes bacterium AC-334-K16]|jgi:DmsE family decaheme c-type cytochrome|nr:DmsE family decaheme c-type cytochrome [Candidatus Aminicenantes bacterium AC-334-K16]
MKKLICLFTLGACFFFLGMKISGSIPLSGEQEKTYIGQETCLECHDLLTSLDKTAHYQISLKKKELEIEGCEVCHGPGSLHAEDPEVKGLIRSFTEIGNSKIISTCLTCHDTNKIFHNFSQEKHAQAGQACLSCHAIHQGEPAVKLLASSPREICFNCHQDKLARFNLPFHHKVQEGRMECWDCHDPHQTETTNQQLGLSRISEKCFTCHPAQRGPFTYEHLAVAVGGCLACHQPHGSENARLLRRANQYLLCLECHSGPIEAANLYGSKTPKFHITTHSTYQNCTICHVKIHGSYLDKHFLR